MKCNEKFTRKIIEPTKAAEILVYRQMGGVSIELSYDDAIVPPYRLHRFNISLSNSEALHVAMELLSRVHSNIA